MATDNEKLETFLKQFQDPKKVKQYMDDYPASLEAAGLADDHKDLLRNGDVKSVRKAVGEKGGGDIVAIFAIC